MEELDSVLTANVGMFTPKQVTEIMTELDADGSGSLDFAEVLTVRTKLNRKGLHNN